MRLSAKVWIAALLATMSVAPVWAGGTSVEERLEALERRLEIQEEKLRRQMDEIEAQREQIKAQKDELAKTEETKTGPGDFKVFWKDGPRLETNDGSFKLKLGGRINSDWAAITEDDDVKDAVGTVENGTEFRRARLYLEGEMYDQVEFKLQYDFAGGDAAFKDVYVGLTDLPYVGGVRVGQFKEPFSLDELTSANYITFMERGLSNALVPSRGTGVMLRDAVLGERVTWAVGAFKDSDDFGDRISDGEFNYTGRLTGLPWYEDGGKRLVHLGAAYSYRNPNDDQVRFRSRPEVHIAPYFVNTDLIPADNYQLVGTEAALVLGPASLQGEYVYAPVEANGGNDPGFRGWYVYGSYFLTGESRAYKTADGAFDKVKPARPFLWGDQPGLGAWEVALRYSSLDLDDTGIAGGDLGNLTAGLNWYLNTNTRVMMNYLFADLDDVGDMHAFQMRFQVFL